MNPTSAGLLSNPRASIRETYRAHLWLYLMGAPFIALIQYAPNLAVKTYDAHFWVPVLAALVPASHFLAIFFTGAIARGNKTRWVVAPMIISNVIFFLFLFVPIGPRTRISERIEADTGRIAVQSVEEFPAEGAFWLDDERIAYTALDTDPGLTAFGTVAAPVVRGDDETPAQPHKAGTLARGATGLGWVFALVFILGYSLRAPIISAQSAIFRTNYPPELRSYALSVPLGFQMAGVAVYAAIMGPLFDISEKWVTPAILLSAVMGIYGAYKFRGVVAEPMPATQEPKRHGIMDQFRALRTNRGFLWFQIAYMFFGSGFVAILAVLPFYLETEFKASHTQATMAINTISSMSVALTMPLWGRLLDRYNPVVMRTIVNGIWTLTPVLLYFATSMNGVYAAQLVQGCVWSGSTLIWWLGVNYYARPHEVANLMSVHQTLTGARGIIAPFLGAWIGAQYGYRNSMIFWFLLMLVGFFIMLGEVARERKLGKLRTFSESEATMDQAPEGEGESS